MPLLSLAVGMLLHAATSATPATEVPLINVGRAIAVRAKIDGRDALLEIDTGSFELRLDPEFADRNRLSEQSVSLQIGNLAPARMKPLIEPLLGGEAPVLPAGFAPKADGIVGLDFLRRYALGIDHVNGKIAFWSGGISPIELDQWIFEGRPARIPLRTQGSQDWFRINAKIGAKPVELIVDTGTAFSTVQGRMAKSLNARIVGETTVQMIGRTARMPIAMVPSITFGPLTAEFPVVGLEPDGDDSPGILGTESLGLGKAIIDMPNQALYVLRLPTRRGNPLERRLRSVGIDMFLSKPGELLVIVRPDSVADRAGLQSGDRLIAFGGTPVEELFAGEMTPLRMRKLLDLGITTLSGPLDLKFRAATGRQVLISIPKPERQ